MGRTQDFWSLVRSSLAFDYRSMALFRLLSGLCVVGDALHQTPLLKEIFTDDGVLPREHLLTLFPDQFLSLYFVSGTYTWALMLNLLQVALGLMFMIGFRPKLAAFGIYVLLVSATNRNFLIYHFGDSVLRHMIFLSIFLPTDRYFSVQQCREKPGEEPGQKDFFSFWVLAFTAEVVCLYFFTFLLKDHPSWKTEYSAVYYIFHLDDYVSGIGAWLGHYPFFVKLATMFSIYIEGIVPWVLILSWIAGRYWWFLKFIVISLFWGLHLGILLTLRVGTFPFTCLALWTIFIPGIFWDRITNYFSEWTSVSRFYYDLPSFAAWSSRAHFKVPRWALEGAGAIMLVTIVLWNVSTIDRFHFSAGIFGNIRKTLSLDVSWRMFAPYPRYANTWLELTGHLDDGSMVDLLNGSRNLNGPRNQGYLKIVENFRYQKLLEAVGDRIEYAPVYANYFCRRWNERGLGSEAGRTLKRVDIISFGMPNLRDGKRGSAFIRYGLDYHCGDSVVYTPPK
jgi:hypothetical protein